MLESASVRKTEKTSIGPVHWWSLEGSALPIVPVQAISFFSAPSPKNSPTRSPGKQLTIWAGVAFLLIALWAVPSGALEFPANVYVTVDVANIRQGPSTENPVTGKVLTGARLRALEESGGWYRVQWGDGREGWIYGKLVSPERPIVDEEKWNQAQEYLAKGNLYYNQGQLDEAIEQYELALELVEDLADAYYNLANVFYDKEDRAKAVEYLQRALESDPRHARAHYNLGLIYYEEGNYGSAKEEWEKAVALKPDMLEARYNLALVTERFDLERAIKLWETYLETVREGDENKGAVLRVQEHVRFLKGQ